MVFFRILEPESTHEFSAQLLRSCSVPEPLDTFTNFLSKFVNLKIGFNRLRFNTRANIHKQTYIGHSYRKKFTPIRRVPVTMITFSKSRVSVLTLFLVRLEFEIKLEPLLLSCLAAPAATATPALF